MARFSGRTVMVTGAGKNIGREIALSFALEGANVVVCDYDKENAKKVTAEINEMPNVSAMAAVCDVRDREAIFAYVDQAISRYGKIDFLVNNAGGSAKLLNKLTRFADAEPETFNFVLDVNIKGTFHCTQAVLRSMIENNYGKVINISSIAAICGLYDRVDYAAAKAAQIGMAKALAMEVGEYNICVNCISPGAINRNGSDRQHMTYLGKEGHAGNPKDIADTVMFLAENDYITGQNFIVDGGRTLGPGHR